MTRLRRLICGCVIAACAAAAGASVASAATFYVNATTGSNSNSCLSSASACKTINEAAAKARLDADTNTIVVSAGTYAENVFLLEAGDEGLTIEGAGSGTVIEGVGSGPAMAAAEHDEGPFTLRSVRVVGPASMTNSALIFVGAPYSLQNVSVELQNAADASAAIIGEKTSGRLDHVTIGGAWTGPALIGVGSTTISNSKLHSAGGVLFVPGTPGGHNDVISASTLQSSSTPVHTGVLGAGVDLTIDSSLLLGGYPYGIEWIQASKPPLASVLTVSGSTIDAGVLGTADAPPVYGVFAVSEGPPGVPATANIKGSIVLEKQFSGASEVKDPMTVACSNSDIPGQTQLQAGTEGAIECATGANGNTSSTPASLFVAAGSGDYQLTPSSAAVDSVPAGAMSLPFGLTPSATDAEGSPRVVDGNGDCIALQDKGAFELQGHAAPCPVARAPAPAPAAPPAGSAPPIAGAITALTITPSAFHAAPSGATIAARKYGATVSYRDSQTATTTFTILRESTGRRQGRSCKKPSGSNRHGKRCTLLTPVGSFVHSDLAGAVSFHFSGRVHGHALAPGSYRLQAVPHDAAGNGAAVQKGFRVK